MCRKLKLRPGMRVLNIGCGWGGTARFAAERYHVAVVGITVSEEQVKHAQRLCEGLDVEIRLQDYRGLAGTYDRALSCRVGTMLTGDGGVAPLGPRPAAKSALEAALRS